MKNEKANLAKQTLVIHRGSGSGGKLTVEMATIKKAALTLRALNHPLRKKLLELIQDNGNIIVTEMYNKLKIEQSVCSQHLGILRRADVVTTKRDGKKILYTVNAKRIDEIYGLAKEMAQRVEK